MTVKERAEDEKKYYKASEEYGRLLERFNRYMNSMKLMGYRDLCKRLRIDENISIHEQDEILFWIYFLKDEGIDVRQTGAARPSNERVQLMRKAAENLDVIIDERYQSIEERRIKNEEIEREVCKEQFLEYAESVSDNVLFVWHQYKDFFDTDFFNDIVFLGLFHDMNAIGKQLVLEIIYSHLDEEDFSFTDSQIDLYESMKQISLPLYGIDRKKVAEQVWDEWAYFCRPDAIEWCVKLTEKVLTSELSDWAGLIAYHQLEMTASDLLLHGIAYMTFLNCTLFLIMSSPSMRSKKADKDFLDFTINNATLN